jgi:hypothetical protein
MNIELKAFCDQGGATEGDINSTVWEFYLDGKPFPKINNLMTLTQAHKIANKLWDMEEEMDQC